MHDDGVILCPTSVPAEGYLEWRPGTLIQGEYREIAGTVVVPGRPTQYLFWPMSCTIRTQTYTFPDPSNLYRDWLTNLGRE